MPLTILNNSASQLALRDINKETSDACKSLKKVANGQKITSAQDDESGYAISERMMDQIRSLAKDKENAQNGAALLKIASGGVENIVESLRQLKEMAVNAATDTNTSDDRAMLQKNLDQIREHINDVATTTQYNSKNIIDGTYGTFYTIGEAWTNGVTSSPYPTLETTATNKPLVIHSGTKAGQSISFHINDMHTSSLRNTRTMPEEIAAYYSKNAIFFRESENETIAKFEEMGDSDEDWEKYGYYVEAVERAALMSIDDISFTTRDDANIALHVIDYALDYALNEATNIGAYLQRLEHTIENITTTEENTQSAESTIRDADMAKEYSSYAKANVLAQAAQSVLAQANQNSSDVISLLR